MVLNFPKTFLAGYKLLAADMNAFLSAIGNVVNGNIGNDNITSDSASRIKEEKIKMSLTTGHRHDGVESKRIILPPMALGVIGVVYEDLNTPPLLMTESRPVTQIRVIAGTAGTGGDTTVECQKRASGETEWTTLSTQTLTASSLVTGGALATTLAVNDCIRMVITAVPSTPPTDVTMQLYEELGA